MPSGGFAFGRFRLDIPSKQLFCDDLVVELPPRYVDALMLLVSRAGEVISRDQLMEAVWKNVVNENTVEQAMSRLRRALVRGGGTERIETVRSNGYRFIGHIQRLDARLTHVDVDALLAPHRAFLDGRAMLETLEAAEVERARRTFERLVAMDSTDASAHVGLANACVLQYEATRADPAPDTEALRLAVTHARQACELSPGNAEAWATLGFALERVGDRDRAVAALTRAAKIDPRNWLHHLRLAYASWGKDRIVAAERALALMPGNPLACVLIATVFVARGVFFEAELALEPGLRAMALESSGPSRFSAVALYFIKGLLCLARGDEDGAQEAFRRELSLEGRGHLYARECSANTWCAIGAVHLRRGEDAAARAACEQAMTRVPQHPMAHAALTVSRTPGVGDDQPTPVLPGPASVDLAVARAICLVAAGDAIGAADLVESALAAAPPGSAGWRIPIEPLLDVERARDAWARVLEQLRRRAV